MSHQLAVMNRLSGAKPDVLAVSKSLCTQASCISLVRGAVVHAHLRKISPHARLHLALQPGRQWLATSWRLDATFHAGFPVFMVVTPRCSALDRIRVGRLCRHSFLDF